MARPIKPGLNYFPLDVDIEQDEKIALVEAEHGLKGFAIIIKLLLKTYKRGYFFEWGKKEQLLFSKMNNVDINSVNVVINDCLEWGLFHKNLFKNKQILTSHGIQTRYLEGTSRRQKVEMISEYCLLSKKEVNANINLIIVDINYNLTEVNDDISTQTRLDKTIQDETREEKKKNSSSDMNPFEFFQQNFGVIKPFVSESIGKWCDDLSNEIVIEAMLITVKNGASNFAYSEAILKEWANNKLKTIDEVRSHEMSKKAKKDQQQRNNGGRRWNQPKVEPLPKALTEPQVDEADPEELEKAKQEAAKYRELLNKKREEKQRLG